MTARYATILADLPWEFGSSRPKRYPSYPLTSLEAICALPVGQLADDNAHLWLWVTNPSLFAGKDLEETG